MTALELRRAIEDKGKIEGCRIIARDCESEEQADALLLTYSQKLLSERKYAAAGTLLWGERMFNLQPESAQRVWRGIQKSRKLLIPGGGSVGKCLAKGTEVMMWDGSSEVVENIEKGDLIMGDDSTPRRVKSVTRGRSKMYEVIPAKGESWICNEHHILTLKCSASKENGHGGKTSPIYTKGRVIDIPVSEFAAKSETFKGYYKQFQVPISFPAKPVQFDPYIYGMWLGDGGVDNPVLHNADAVLIHQWCSYFKRLGYTIYVGGENKGPCRAYYCRNGTNKKHPFKDFIRSSISSGQKIIKPEYLNNSREVRMELLAGIIDTDGTRTGGSGYSIISKFPKLARGIQRLAISLGFYASFSNKRKTIKSLGFVGYYYEVYIGGNGCWEIPTRLKKTAMGNPKKDRDCASIQVRELPIDEYFGFETDGNHRFVLASGVVTHNSYTGICWILLDWLADAEFTTVKLISTTGGHAKANTLSTILSLHKNAICPLMGYPRAESLALFESDKRACISVVAIKEGQDNSGVLQGFHPLPRPKRHPIFGDSSRVRAVFDEAEEVPNGGWSGVDNLLTAAHGTDVVKIMAFYNPKDISSRTAQLGEPKGGWGQFDVETGVEGKDEWKSREGWDVVRIDPKKTENVRERKMIFSGFQTWEGYSELANKNGGNSLNYYTFGRGCYPPDSALMTVIPQRVMSLMRGEFVFTGKTVNVGSADIAIDGRDEAIFSKGRWGAASAFKRWLGSGWEVMRFREPRDVLQLDQQFALPKGSAEIVGQAIKLNCIKLGIAPEWTQLDSTGNGSPVWNYLKIPAVWSPAVRGLDFGQPSTEMKILEQDFKKPSEEFEGIHSEVWFALSRWAEFGYFAISPSVRSGELERELIGRRYLLGAGEKIKVEKKEVFNKRLGRSPDWADSATILVNCARINASVIASMTGVSSRSVEVQGPLASHGPVDRVTWVDAG